MTMTLTMKLVYFDAKFKNNVICVAACQKGP